VQGSLLTVVVERGRLLAGSEHDVNYPLTPFAER
jgi:hypothetical protein